MERVEQDSTDDSLSVLVVDDEVTIIEVVCNALELGGYSIDSASGVDQALEKLESNCYGVLIVDKNLTEDSGLRVVREAARLHPLAKTIVLTGYPSVSSAIESVELGAFDYLTKPLELDRLRERVDAARRAYLHDQELSLSASRHESLFELIPGVVWVVGRDGRIQRINNRGAEALGYQPDELIGMLHRDLIVDDPRDPSDDWAFLERRTGDRATRRKLIRLRGKDGNPRLFEVHSVGTYDPVDPAEQTGTIGVAHDVTELAEFHRRLRENNKTEALGELVGEVVHDFRSLLTIILGNCDMLKLGPDRIRPGRNPIGEIESAARRATTLVERLLAFQRDEPVALVELSLERVVHDLQGMLEQLLPPSYELDVETSLAGELVVGDWQQLEQVLLNLVINARDAMDGGGKIVITTRPSSGDDPFAGQLSPGRYACLSVEDAGVGMTTEQIEQATRRYYTTKRNGRGTGIGLASVERIVKQHGGHLFIESSPGKGTTVVVVLPVSGSGDRP